ncbi:MAG: response regulator [Cyclobacteriaceae bacterium]|jgi:PAS domain S-box-containing protein|nr:response regulator [Cyclobacteriaceae bacterium]
MKSLSTYVKKGLFYKSVVDDGSDIIFIVNYEGTILYHNHSVQETLGYKTSGLVGKNFFDYLPAHLLADFKKEFKKSTRRAYNKSIEFQFICRDKRYKYLEFNSVNLKQKEGIEGLILDCRDISQRKKDAEELLRAQKAKEQFLANISHEIRTPINGIAGMASLLSQNPSKEEQRTYLNAIKSAADNLKVIINDILDLASIESGKLQLEKIGFNLNDLLHSLIDTFGVQASEKGIRLSYILAKDANKIFVGDPVRLSQILINLISNAIKFTHAGSIKVEVKVDKVKGTSHSLRFSISDTGIGIPKDKLQTIFESFSQADASVTRKYGGTGLGLTIVKQLVELQAGSIDVVSKENEGSTFTFTLPYVTGKKEFESDARMIKPRNFTQLKRASILLVEDNDINRLYASSILKMWGCHFETAENGVVALEKIRNNAFDAILMDIQMPVMDGFETTKAIRKGDPNKSQVPIIALTANATQKDFEKCIAAGMNDCITKPFTQEDLQQTLTRYLGSKLKKKNQSAQEVKKSIREFDLTYLIKASDNNQEFIQEIINTFLESMPKTIEEIQIQLQRKNWEHLAKVVHKIKPSITLMGIHHLKEKIALLEHEAKTSRDEKTIEGLATEVSQSLSKVILSLKAYA